MFPDLRKLPYEQRLSHFRLWSLEERRNRANLFEVFKMIKESQLHHGLYSLAEWKTTQPEVTTGNWKRNIVVQILDFTSSLTELSTVGTVSHSRTLMLRRWTSSKVGLIEKEIRRWTSSKSNSLPSPISCTILYQYEDCIWIRICQVQPHPVSLIDHLVMIGPGSTKLRRVECWLALSIGMVCRL